MRLPHLPGLISMEQKGSVAAIVSPAGGIRSTGRVLGQQAREGRHKEVGQGTGHGGGRGQRPALFEKDRYAGSLPDFAFDVQPPVVQRGYLAA